MSHAGGGEIASSANRVWVWAAVGEAVQQPTGEPGFQGLFKFFGCLRICQNLP